MSLFDPALDAGLDPLGLDSAYLHLRDDPDCADDRVYVDDAWKIFQPYADRHFTREFRLAGKFQSRAWELRLACTLLDVGLQFTSRNAGPDFTLNRTPAVHIEAVAPATTEALTSNYAAARSFGTTVPVNELVLRYTTGIASKLAAHERYRMAGLIRDDDAYIVAISGANIPQASLGGRPFPFILLPLFGLEQLDRQNENGASVRCDIFLPAGRTEISAVIFSPHHIKNRPEVWGLPPGSDFLMVHNPNAATKVPRGLVPRGREWEIVEGRPRLVVDWRPAEAA